MRWTVQTVATLSVGAAAIVGGAFLSRYVSAEAGTLLIATGGYLLGLLREQPGFAKPGQ